MFEGATAFNTDIGSWVTNNVTTMSSMFKDATTFNSDIGSWDVTKVIDMNSMFMNALLFNTNINLWIPESVNDMSNMFKDATTFNSDISAWTTTSVTNMNSMFMNATNFNQNIGSWDVANVTDMNSMLKYASSFNQNIGDWIFTGVIDMENILLGSNLDYSTYSLFIRDLSTNNFITTGMNIATINIGFYRTDDVATTNAYEYLISRNIIINDGNSLTEEEISIMYNMDNVKIIMTNDLSTYISNEYTIITDSGNTLGNYYSNENITHTLTFTNAISLSIYLVSEVDVDLLNISGTTIDPENSNTIIRTDISGVSRDVIDISNYTSITINFSSNTVINHAGYIIVLRLMPVLISNICFRRGTPINTDQGLVDIDKINKKIHTIRNNRIKHITETISKSKELVLVMKDAIYNNIPSLDTVMTKEHAIFYKGKLVKIDSLVNNSSIIYIENTGEKLYNVLLDKHDLMIVNNILAETLHPTNLISRIYNESDVYDIVSKCKLFRDYNDEIYKQNLYAL